MAAAFLPFAHRLADASGAVIRPHFRQPMDVVNKQGEGFDPVTVADRDAETAIRALIAEHHPDHGILGEEHGHQPGTAPFTWIIDPIDGTRAFIAGLPMWGTLLALAEEGRPTLGVLDQPVLGERFFGTREAAFYRGPAGEKPLRVRPCARLEDATVSTTHPWAYFSAAEQSALQPLWTRARLTRFGGDCYAYGLLAMGFIDLIAESTLKVWDVAALIPIIEGAGGVCSDWRGNDPAKGGQFLASGDHRLHEEALRLLRPAAA